MSSLRRLVLPTLEAQPQVLGAPDGHLDEATQALLQEAAQEAYERGCRDGAAVATEAAQAATVHVTEILQRLDGELRRTAAQVDVALAGQIAAAVLDREPADDTAALLRKVEAALAALDDDPLTVHVNAGDVAPLAEALAAMGSAHGAEIGVVADPSLAPGDARIAGRWSRADLTRRGAWDAVSTLLEEVAS